MVWPAVWCTHVCTARKNPVGRPLTRVWNTHPACCGAVNLKKTELIISSRNHLPIYRRLFLTPRPPAAVHICDDVSLFYSALLRYSCTAVPGTHNGHSFHHLEKNKLRLPKENMPQKVVVIGGGYAGIKAAIGLDKAFDVTVVAGGDCFRHVVYGLRASAIPEETPRMLPSYDNMLKVCMSSKSSSDLALGGSLACRNTGAAARCGVTRARGGDEPR